MPLISPYYAEFATSLAVSIITVTAYSHKQMTRLSWAAACLDTTAGWSAAGKWFPLQSRLETE